MSTVRGSQEDIDWSPRHVPPRVVKHQDTRALSRRWVGAWGPDRHPGWEGGSQLVGEVRLLGDGQVMCSQLRSE